MSLATDTTMDLDPVRDRTLLVDLVTGAAAGIIAGAIVLAVAMVFVVSTTTMEATLPIKNVAATWMGVGALIGGPGTVAIGVVSHLLIAAIWGSVFGLLGGARIDGGANMAAGITYGTVVWVLMTHLVMPVANPVMEARVELLPAWWWFTVHLVFGLVLALVIRCSASGAGPGSADPRRNRDPRRGQLTPAGRTRRS